MFILLSSAALAAKPRVPDPQKRTPMLENDLYLYFLLNIHVVLKQTSSLTSMGMFQAR